VLNSVSSRVRSNEEEEEEEEEVLGKRLVIVIERDGEWQHSSLQVFHGV
jgi:hypothetical protein